MTSHSKASLRRRRSVLKSPLMALTPAPDAFCSFVSVGCAFDSTSPNYPSASELWRVVERLCEWIRVKCRHYWLLHGQAGFAATFHASVLTQQGNVISQRNAVGYGRNLVILPLDRDLWISLEAELNSNFEPPVS